MTATLLLASNERSVPPNAGGRTTVACTIPGTTVSIPYLARPFTLTGVSTRATCFPINVNRSGVFNGTSFGTGTSAAACTRLP